MRFSIQKLRSPLFIVTTCLLSTVLGYSYLTLDRQQSLIPPVIAQNESSINQPQKLPLKAKFTVKRQTIKLEVANTSEEQMIGLMFRTDLADDRGMLFNFTPSRPVKFWMKNTLIPLDMIFLEQGIIKYIATDVPPCEGDPCPIYGPDEPIKIDQVIELRAGRVQELKLKVGSPLITKPLQPFTSYK